MRRPGPTWLLAALVAASFALDLAAGEPTSPLTDTSFLRDYAQTRGFSLGRPLKPKITPDNRAVLFLRAQPRLARLELYEFDIASGQTRLLVSPDQVLQGATERLSAEEKARRERMRVTVGGFTDFQLSTDGKLVLLSLGGKLYTFDRSAPGAPLSPPGSLSSPIRALHVKDGPVLDPRFSPDGRSVAYVRAHDVRVLDLARQKEHSVTTGGTDRVSHGLAEFVAQEEMDRFTGYWWSPDSRAIAYEEADASAVETWFLANPADPGQAPRAAYYPRPGNTNVSVRLGVVSRHGGRTVWVQWDVRRFPYLARVDWDRTGGLTLAVQTRDQKELALLRADPQTGWTERLLTERDAAWVNLDQEVPRWLSNGSGFLWSSERDGGRQLELRDPQGRFVRCLVPPSAGYQGLVGVARGAGQALIQGSVNPTESHLYRVSLGGGELIPLTPAPELHHATASQDGSLYVRQAATPDQMTRTFVCRADGSIVGELPSVAEEPPFKAHAELLKVGDPPGFYARVIRPHQFHARKHYPVLVNVYGGPHVNMVQASMAGQLLNQWLADQGFVVVSLDGRGTPGRGRDWERAISRRLGEVPLADQVDGLLALADRFREMDLERVGVFGWSFGGYLSGLAALRRPDIFRAAVAGAPVTDWLDYDTHYTERYLGLPGEDPAVYRNASLLTYAAELRVPLLLIHGTVDDNVYFRHSLRLADALFRAGKPFEFLPLPGFTHLVPDPEVSERLWSRIATFFLQHLGPPSD